MRVLDLRREANLEVGVVFNGLVAQFDLHKALFFESALVEHCLKRWVHLFANLL